MKIKSLNLLYESPVVVYFLTLKFFKIRSLEEVLGSLEELVRIV